MAPGQLTDSLLGTYVQVIVAILLFALGLPALIFQLTASEDVRRVAARNGLLRERTLAALIVTYVLILVAYIFFVNGSRVVTSPSDWAGALLFVGAVILAVIGWWTRSGGYVRERVVRSLESRMLSQLKRSGLTGTPELRDLIYLGENGRGEYQKELVLRALERIENATVSHASYRGSNLEELVLGVENVALARQSGETPRISELACQILEGVAERIEQVNSPDAAVARRALGRLAIESVSRWPDATTLRLLESVSADTNVLLDMGVAALRSGKNFVAVAVLSKLEARAELSSFTSEERANLLALLAHFWASGGATRRRAAVRLQSFFMGHPGAFEEWLTEAIRMHELEADYDSADALEVLMDRLAEPPRVPEEGAAGLQRVPKPGFLGH